MITTKIQLRFNDMDPMRRVNNASYSTYLELARLDFCNQYLKINQLEDIPFVLARVEMDLIRSVLPGDEIAVRIWVSRIGNTSWDFDYEIFQEKTNHIYVKAKTVQVYFDYRLGKKLSIPESFRQILEKEKN
ncbi:thioesterase [Leptospira kobayashii]|uniref:Thioesterase n=1 Tax=Leptospira kobayashii TaxID=1917830 RepID=A0ABN6KFS2_9LEPT|nr:thioesterase family protein [Leptospira kobayashii]BDA79984.1 thioesterase [Leptospira kobayashii]